MSVGVISHADSSSPSMQSTHQSVCQKSATPIHRIQNTGLTSPLKNTEHTIQGVVIGRFPGKKSLNGFFVQEEQQDQDNNPATSEGIFIYAPRRSHPNVGEQVRVTGKVSEYYGLTQLNSISELVRCGKTKRPPTTPLSLPVDSLKQFEAVEGMRVQTTSPLNVANQYHLDRFGTLTLSQGRLYQPTQWASPGPIAKQQQTALALNQLILDARAIAGRRFRTGSLIEPIEGVLGFAYGQYRLYPTDSIDVQADARPPPPKRTNSNSTTIALLNLNNFFNGNGQGGGFPTPRGAKTLTEFKRQSAKIVATITALNADIVGLTELENDGFDQHSAIQTLINHLKNHSLNYRFIKPKKNILGRDAICVGLMYQPHRTTPVGSATVLDNSVDTRFLDSHNRPVLAQTFRSKITEHVFTIAVAHLKSKGSDCNDLQDPDRKDGQGHCNQTRTSASQTLAQWLLSDPTNSQDPDFLIIGDLNSYAKEDPIKRLEQSGFQNLVANRLGLKQHTFQFSGKIGTLDYALATPSLTKHVSQIHIWHSNSDEPIDAGYRHSSALTPFRASDHDPIFMEINSVMEINSD